MTQIRIFRASDEPQVIQLWQACGLVVPWNVPTWTSRENSIFNRISSSWQNEIDS
jgi:hypothetical protein